MLMLLISSGAASGSLSLAFCLALKTGDKKGSDGALILQQPDALGGVSSLRMGQVISDFIFSGRNRCHFVPVVTRRGSPFGSHTQIVLQC
mmetsp:Transcript_108327/g.215148  ORF Transcript_108327/g.215148 Transcript_108327/m.215148 type:complete len:90 (-) Transcript_108327:36-305(-)